jgi:hypothetical protein
MGPRAVGQARRARQTRALAAALSVASLLAVVGTAAPAAAQSTSAIDVTVTLTSKQTVLTQVGRGGAVTYGWNQLSGSATTPSGPTAVDILGNVNYTNGSGPFFGFLSMHFASQSTVAFLMQGRAAKQPDGSTKLKASLTVIDGNAAFTGAKGSGAFTGSRAAALGSPIVITIKAKVRLT